MYLSRTLSLVAIAAASCVSLVAQQPQSGFHTVACIKVRPDKGADFRKFAAEDLHKFAQARADSGAVSIWYLLHTVYPAGKSAECDYLSVTMYPGTPPEPMDMDGLAAVLKKAGIASSAQEFVDRRNSLTELVSSNLFQNQFFVGGAKKGDYFMVNYMKVANVPDWLAYEKKVWQPIAESLVKDGLSSGWSVNVQLLPGGTDMKFQGVTVDVYPTWDSVFKGQSQIGEHFKKAHPDMEIGTTLENFEKLRTIESTDLYFLQDMVVPAK